MSSMSRIDIDCSSTTWVAIREWAEAKLANCRQRNDGSLSADETAALRGQIACLKELLSLEIKDG